MSSFMRGPAAAPPMSTTSQLTSLQNGLRELRTEVHALTEAIAALAKRVDTNATSARNGVVATAAVANALSVRIGHLEHSAVAAIAEATGEPVPEKAEEDDVVGRVLSVMTTVEAAPAAAPTSAKQEEPKSGVVNNVSLPPPPPAPAPINRGAQATALVLGSGGRKRNWRQ